VNDSDANVVEMKKSGDGVEVFPNLPVGGVSPEMEAATNIKKRVFDKWMPDANVFDGTGTPNQICFGYTAMDKDYVKALLNFIPGNACDPGVAPKTRIDALCRHYAIVGARETAESMWHPILNQPTTPLYNFFGGMGMVANYVGNMYQTMPDTKALMRTRMRQQVRTTPYDRADVAKAFFANDSAGITEDEKQGAIATLEQMLTDEARDSLREVWLSFDGSPEEYDDELWPIYDKANREFLEVVKNTAPKREGPWGRQVYVDMLAELGITKTPEDVVVWAEQRRQELESAANEVAKMIEPNSKCWQDVWFGVNPPDMITDDDELLAAYRKRTGEIMEKYRNQGLIPENLPGCGVEINFTDGSLESQIPIGACMPAPRESSEPGGPRISTFIVSRTRDNMEKKRQHGYFFESLIGHELCGHGVQGHYSCKMPYIITNTGRLYLAGLEGHAFSLEFFGWKYGILKKNLFTFLGILQGRIQRAARIIVEMKYHLRYPGSDTKSLVSFYAQQSAMDEAGAQEDCRRAFGTPGSFIAYYLGASLAQAVIELRGENKTRETLRQWCEETGSFLPANFFAYAKGWVKTPQDISLPESDIAATTWQKEKNKFVGLPANQVVE